MKRKLAILLCGLMIFSMSSCAEATSSEAESISEDAETTENVSSEPSDDEQTTDEAQEDVDSSLSDEESEFGISVVTLDWFFSNYNDMPDLGGMHVLSTGTGKLSEAYNETTGTSCWFDAYGNIYYTYQNGVLSKFEGGQAALKEESETTGQRCFVLKEKNKDNEWMHKETPAGISDGDGNDIIYYGEDSTGYTLWTVKKEDLVTGTTLVLTAWDNDGNIKLQASTDNEPFDIIDINACYDGLMQRRGDNRLDLYDKLYYVGDSYYRFNASTNNGDPYYYLNVKDGSVVARGEAELEFYDDIIINTSNSYFDNGDNVDVMNKDFSLRFSSFTNNPAITERRGMDLRYFSTEYSNGLLYLGGGKDIASGYYDANGNCIIDLSAYNVTRAYPFEPEGVAVIEMKNPDEVQFVGLLGKDGNWVVDPQKAGYATVTNGFFLVPTDNGNLLYDYTGALRSDLFNEGQITGISMSEKDENGIRVGTVTFKAVDGGEKITKVFRLENDTTYTYLASYT